MSKSKRLFGYLMLAPIAIIALPLVLVLIPAAYLVNAYQSAILRLRLRHTWPAQTWILLAYTQSDVWAPCLESEVIPRLGNACIAIDRSTPDWKQRYPIEARAIEHWGGYYEHNPLVILFPRWRPAKVVRLYKAFLDNKHGKPQTLETELARLFALVESLGLKQQ